MKKKNLNYLVSVYKEQLEKGDVQVAYSELVKYVQKLKTLFSKNLGQEFSCGNVFQGYMDYTYFYLSNEYLKNMKLKLGLVLNHKEMRFEVWLLGQTKEIQEKYWNLLKDTKWVQSPEIPQYSVLEVVLVDNPDFNNLDSLCEKIRNTLLLVSGEISSSLRSLGSINKSPNKIDNSSHSR